MIYLDPPYGIKFGSNWQVAVGEAQRADGAEADLTGEPENDQSLPRHLGTGYSFLPELPTRPALW